MNTKIFYTLFALLVTASIFFWAYMFYTPAEPDPVSEVSNDEIVMTMYHGEGCMCCGRWAEYLEDYGVTVKEELLQNPHDLKDEYNIPGRLRSCHTAIVDGYVVEGHVPLEAIQKLLSERPDAIGISVPGMPPNAPGMDQPVDNEYQVVLFDDENMSVYSVHN